MKCYLCGATLYVLMNYKGPDKYQMLLENPPESPRAWMKCPKCELHEQVNDLTSNDLDDIYSHYRDIEFRGENVEDAFQRIEAIPPYESENFRRYNIFRGLFPESARVLDVGSGLGVFPDILCSAGYKIDCVELNKDSQEFLRLMGFLCVPGVEDLGDKKYDVVSLIHVLEHIKQPIPFIQEVTDSLKENGSLFIEVPDSKEFETLPKDHDEFNSLHYFFYNLGTLNEMLRQAGMVITESKRIRYGERNLTRLIVVAERGEI